MKKVIKIILIIFGAFLILDALFMSVAASFNLGNVFAFTAGLIFLFYGIFFGAINSKGGWVKWVRYIFYVGGAVLLCMIIFITGFGLTDNSRFDEDAVIVLGAGIRGGEVTRVLAYRLDRAVEYTYKNPRAVIVVTGGRGAFEDLPEAEVMEKYLMSKGVDKDKIIKENDAANTYENFVFSKELLDEHFKTPYKTVFITNTFHIYRSSFLAKKIGMESTHIHADEDWFTMPLNYLRECAALIAALTGYK